MINTVQIAVRRAWRVVAIAVRRAWRVVAIAVRRAWRVVAIEGSGTGVARVTIAPQTAGVLLARPAWMV
jgi:hypothetical protein